MRWIHGRLQDSWILSWIFKASKHSQDFRNYTHWTSEALLYWKAEWPLQFATLATPFSPGETLQQLIRMVKLLGLKVGIILHTTHAGKDLGMLGSHRCDTKKMWKMVLLDINFPKWTPTSGVELLCPCPTCVLHGGLDVQNTARAQHWDPISGAFLLWFHWPFRKIAPKLVSKTCFAARQDFETMAQTFMLSFRMPHYACFWPCFVTF